MTSSLTSTWSPTSGNASVTGSAAMDESLRRLTEALLAEAGFPEQFKRASLFDGGWTNKNWLVELTSGKLCVLRQYRWPHESPDMRRVEKEIYLHRILLNAGVPVPAVLAGRTENEGALLLEHVPGKVLGDVTKELPAEASRAAWRDCGEALRKVHTVQFAEGEFGVIVGNRVEQPAADSWANWRMHNLLHHARELNDTHGLRMPIDELGSVLEDALPRFDVFQPCLLHNDAHVWNVLVDTNSTGCRCTGWLDWEYAWVGDPNWDLARTDIWRIRDIGATPESFWDGYGALPDEPHFTFHQMSLYLWIANEQLSTPTLHPSPSHQKALEYVTDFAHQLCRLRQKIDL